MKKLVVKLDLHDDRAKQKALKTVSSLPGIDSISMDMKEKKLTVIGSVDPVNVVSKLRKYWHTDIVSVGPAKEPEKKEEPKKEEGKKEEAPKEEAKKEGGGEEKKPAAEEPKKEEAADKEKKKDDGDQGKKDEEAAKKEDEPKKLPLPLPMPMQMAMPHPYWAIPPPDPRVMAYHRAYNPNMTNYYYAQSMEENPNACVIC